VNTSNKKTRGRSYNHLAASILLPGESRDQLNRLISNLTDEFDPHSSTDFMMLETMVVNRWRTLRNWTVETAGLIHEQKAQYAANSHEDSPTQTALALLSLAKPPRSQETLSRYEVRYDRQFHRAAQYLLRSKAKREEKQAEILQLEQNKGQCPNCKANLTPSKPYLLPLKPLHNPICSH